MTRTGYSKDKQNRLKQLVFESSIARLPTAEVQQIALNKLGIEVGTNWLRRIKKSLKNDAEREFKHLISDSFAFKYEYLQRIQEIKEIQRRKWLIANKKELTNEDLIRLKCLSELEESTILLAEIYDALPGIDSFIPQYEEQNTNGITVREKIYDSKARAKTAELATFTRITDSLGVEREVAEHPDYDGGPIYPDYKGRYPWDEGYDAQAKF